MAKRRPSAADRFIAEWIEQLAPGNYTIDVSDESIANPTGEHYLGLAQLKMEGSLVLNRFPKRIVIYGPPRHGDG